MKTIVISLILAAGLSAETCDSVAAASLGDWKPATSAPRDGTVIEILETFGFAPWYGLFSWKNDHGYQHWVDANDPRMGVIEDSCLYWRPYKQPAIKKYVDPTGGAQSTVAYQCLYMHLRYDKRKNVCVRN